MALTGPRTYVGFGFGAIQAGLFLYEAFRSGSFGRLVAAEVAPEPVEEVRRAGGFYAVNIAHADRVEAARVGPVEICGPGVPEDRESLVQALAAAEEIATAIPSVELYASEGPGSLHRVLAQGLARKARERGPRAVVYAAENHNAAAEILEHLVLDEVPHELRDAVRARVRFLNTVIGKMSGLVEEPRARGLATVTPGSGRAFLVEAFHRILVSRIRFDAPFARGLTVFEEKEPLLPFEEAKLYGHNATHALAAYVGRLLGAERVADLRAVPGFMAFLREAFLEESGRALIRRHGGADALFTRAGYEAYADDLLERMTNPFLMDTVERVARDVRRKLGWGDRLVGTMRLALSEGVEPWRYALGAAAALAALDEGFLEGRVSADSLARPLWEASAPKEAEERRVLALLERGRGLLRSWRASGFPDPAGFFGAARAGAC